MINPITITINVIGYAFKKIWAAGQKVPQKVWIWIVFLLAASPVLAWSLPQIALILNALFIVAVE